MTADEERICFFHELGLAISQWSFIETHMYEIVASLSDKGDRRALGFGLFAVENFRSKLAFSDEFLKKQVKNGAHLEEWERLRDRLGKLVVKRNRLAHERVMFFANGEIGRRFALEHWPSDKPRYRKNLVARPLHDALCVRNIVGIRQEFFYLSRALENLHAKLHGRPLPHSISVAPKTPPTIRAIRNQIREALGLPLKPSRKKP